MMVCLKILFNWKLINYSNEALTADENYVIFTVVLTVYCII